MTTTGIKWRVGTVLVLALAPVVFLVCVGFYHLWDRGWSFRAWIPMAVCFVAAYGLGWYWTRRRKLVGAGQGDRPTARILDAPRPGRLGTRRGPRRGHGQAHPGPDGRLRPVRPRRQESRPQGRPGLPPEHQRPVRPPDHSRGHDLRRTRLPGHGRARPEVRPAQSRNDGQRLEQGPQGRRHGGRLVPAAAEPVLARSGRVLAGPDRGASGRHARRDDADVRPGSAERHDLAARRLHPQARPVPDRTEQRPIAGRGQAVSGTSRTTPCPAERAGRC